MTVFEQIIRVNGYIQRELGILRLDGREILCIALDQTCTFKEGAADTRLTEDQIEAIWKLTYLPHPPTFLGVRWWNTGSACIGAVAVETFREEWKAYIGVASGASVSHDTLMIARTGASLTPEEARGIFPSIDASKYKDKPLD